MEHNPVQDFTRAFAARKNSRMFTVCPNTLIAASAIISRNSGLISVCNEEKSDSLVLAHYCDQKEEELKRLAKDGYKDKPKEMFWLVKGCIFDGVGRLVCRGFSFTPRVTLTYADFEKVLSDARPKTLVREWLEGNIVNVWTFQGKIRKVYVSSSRRIDALRSKRDKCPSNADMLELCGVDPNKLANNRGEVYVLLIIHPLNQLTNPREVKPAVFHVDTWGPKEGGGKKRGDTLFSLKRRNVDIGIAKLPPLETSDALRLFEEGRCIYVQDPLERGTMYLPRTRSTMNSIRGERDHLFHRYLELGKDKGLLQDSVAYAFRADVASFPHRFNQEMDELREYVLELFEQGAKLPAPDTSVSALYSALKARVPSRKREDILAELERILGTTDGLVLYNMLSYLRIKMARKPRSSDLSTSSDSSCSDSTCSGGHIEGN